jgi:HSP20 family protein
MNSLETPKTDVPATRTRDVFTSMRNEMDRLFGRFEQHFPHLPHLWAPNNGSLVPDLDVRELDNAIVIEADLPGVAEKDVSVTVANGNLIIKGEKKQSSEEKTEHFFVSERCYGSFERTLRLPDFVDETKIEAKFDNGVLKVTATKKPEAVKAARKIEIKPAA